jgi:type I restriction-modification system DNA methylase subunit
VANEATNIVQRLWNYCHVLRDDGVSYGDYVEQLTYLLFLKRASEGKMVPQDPSDELASVLLERIRAEKARREGEGKGKRRSQKKKQPRQLELFKMGKA